MLFEPLNAFKSTNLIINLEKCWFSQCCHAHCYFFYSLPARTSIIAAANPVGGHYNKAKTVSENLRMNSALLSRFDLVFILLDKPDEEMDGILSEHVMSLHSEKSKKRYLQLRTTTVPSFSVFLTTQLVCIIFCLADNMFCKLQPWKDNEAIS